MDEKINKSDIDKTLDIFSSQNKKCECKDPYCAKCLGLNCEDPDCEVHTKQEKLKYKKRLRTNIENIITRLQSEGQNVNLRHPMRRQLAQLNMSIRELEGIEPVLNIDYRYGYGPDGSWFKRLYGKMTMFLFILFLVSIPTLALFGLYSLIKMIFKF